MPFGAGVGSEFGGHVFSADMVARGKPHPDIFLLAAGRLGVSPDRCLVIEDSASGIKAAVAAGMSAVGLCAASHIRAGHDLKLRDAGAVHLAHSWADVERFAVQFWNARLIFGSRPDGFRRAMAFHAMDKTSSIDATHPHGQIRAFLCLPELRRGL